MGAAGSLGGQVAIVTGGATGIGASIVRRFAVAGADLAVVAHSSVEAQNALVAQLQAQGTRAIGYRADLSRAGSGAGLIESIAADFGRIDILVNNAGLMPYTPLFASGVEEFERTLSINLSSAYAMIHAAAPIMRAQGYGRIINISSSAAVSPMPGFAAYAVSKAGLLQLTKAIALELAGTGITINCIAPGAVATAMNAHIREEGTPETKQMIAALRAKLPSPHGIAFLDPEDIAGVAMFLASPEARGLHGTTILVDQGLTIA